MPSHTRPTAPMISRSRACFTTVLLLSASRAGRRYSRDPSEAYGNSLAITAALGRAADVATAVVAASGSADGSVWLWDMDVTSWMRHAWRIANRNLTLQEWQTYLGSAPYQQTCLAASPHG
jgi:hypothetical protein